MNTYLFKFEGREVGAIGITDLYHVHRSGRCAHEAFKRLYDDYEHIRLVQCVNSAGDTIPTEEVTR